LSFKDSAKRAEVKSEERRKCPDNGDHHHDEKFIRESVNLLLFFLRIMKEHAIFLRLGFPCNRTDLINEAREFEQRFDELLTIVRSLERPTRSQVRELDEEALALTEEFIEFKTRVLNMILRCQLGGFNFPLFVDHIRREAMEFVRLLRALLSGVEIPEAEQIAREEAFWSRIMAEHSKFIQHLIDPAEGQFVETARRFAREFDEIWVEALDLLSMTQSRIIVPVQARFTADTIRATRDLRDFKEELRDLIADCRVLSLIPELLADHVLREAEHFLMLLRKHCKRTDCEPFLADRFPPKTIGEPRRNQ